MPSEAVVNGDVNDNNSSPSPIIPVVEVKGEVTDEAENEKLAEEVCGTILENKENESQAENDKDAVNSEESQESHNTKQTNTILNYFSRNGEKEQQSKDISNDELKENETEANKLSKPQEHENVEKSEETSNKIIDEESQKGRFGWATMDKIHIPYVIRKQEEKYCAIKMVESKLLNKYLGYLNPDIYNNCTSIQSYYMTTNESRLFNEINHEHCNSQFGRYMFGVTDLVARLSDIDKFYQFIEMCFHKIFSKKKNDFERCGFIRINKTSLVPFTIWNDEKFVPLFYFEGETEELSDKTEHLSGWDSTYLKFCCKVQGIRKELFSKDKLAVINLKYIKDFFEESTVFEDYWPSKTNFSLYSGNAKGSSSGQWTKTPTEPPPLDFSHGNQIKKVIQHQLLNSVFHIQRPNSSRLPATVNTTSYRLIQPNPQTSGNYVQVRNQNSTQYSANQYNSINSQVNAGNSQVAMQPMITQITATNNAIQQQHRHSGYNTTNVPPAPTGLNFQRQTAAVAPARTRRQQVCIIPELPEASLNLNAPPYKIQRIYVQNVMVQCINLKPYDNSDQLMSIADLHKSFFSQIRVEYCMQLLGALGGKMFKPNKVQLQTMEQSGLQCGDVPLILLRDARTNIRQIRSILQTNQGQGQDPPLAKRTRVL